MKKRFINYMVILLMLVLPVVIYAANLTSYGESVTKANNYINGFADRRKYLLFNKNYVYEKTGFGDSGSFTNGGMLSKGEYDLSVYMNQSYLASGKEYWTLTSNGTNQYYVDAYIQSKSAGSNSGTRVTEYIKPSTSIDGNGTFGNPWTFGEGIEVDIISNNTSFGTVSPEGPQYVAPGSTVRYTLTPSNGYFYNGNKDDCHLVKDGVNKYENFYLARNVSADIKCTAVYELKTYKFDLAIDPNSTDFEGNPKEYTTLPNPKPIYYKYKTNWYSDESANHVITKITPPTMTGWSFSGYYYGDVKVIDSDGTILTKNLDLGTTNDYVDTDHTLVAEDGGINLSRRGFDRHVYRIKFNLNGGKLDGSENPATRSVSYDQRVTINYPTKAGYAFAGWKHNGNSSTAMTIGNGTSQSFSANSTASMDTVFANLTPIMGGEVTMTATWTVCSAGTFNDGTSATCSTCPAGSYTTTTGKTSCTTCEDGYYCTGGTNHTSCPVGTEGTGTGKTSETDGCSKCAAGKYAENVATQTCSTCSAGTYSAAGASSCTACGAGRWSAEGSASCSNITAGCYGTSAGSACPNKCAAGKYSAAGSATCTNCAAGQYSAEGAGSCTACGAGKWSVAGSATCSKIKAGCYGTSASSNCPNKCAAGKYSTEGSATCTDCGPGKWSAVESGSCSNINAGCYGTSASSACPNKCPNGQYSAAGNASCSSCAAGYYSAEGSGTCTACGAGKWSNSGSASCSNINAGCYGTSASSACPNKCAAGKYSAAGSASCSNCAAGTYSSEGAGSCTACGAGKYSAAGSSTCSKIKAGCYGTSASNNCPNTCAAGQYSTEGSSSCTACGAGKYSAAGSATCSNITAGCYGTSASTACPNKCAAGKYSTTGSASCSNCNAGTYSSQGAGSCTACGAGKYSTAGSSSCSNISAGCYGTSASTACPNECAAGTYSAGGAGSCTNCAAGTYSGKKAGSCTACGGGKWSAAGSSSCSNITAGCYGTSAGSACPNKCAAGKYSAAGSASCSNCNAGTYSAAGATTCTACGAGKYSAAGSASCSNISAGCYGTSAGSACPNKCAAGTYSAAGSSSCSNCSAGTYSAAGAGSCTACGAGKYSGAGSSSCSNITAGCYGTSASTACPNKCGAGKYSAAGSASCSNCPSDQWSNAGASSCFSKCSSVTYSQTSTCSVSCGGGRYKRLAYSAYDSSYRCSGSDDWSGSTCNTQYCCNVSNCNSCSGNNYCGTCKSGYYASSGTCVPYCSSGNIKWVSAGCSGACGQGLTIWYAYSKFNERYRCEAYDKVEGACSTGVDCCSQKHVSQCANNGPCSKSCGGGVQQQYCYYVSSIDNVTGCGSYLRSIACNTQKCGGGCFLSGTKVRTLFGYKDIDKVKVGDYVLSYNQYGKVNQFKKVTYKFIFEDMDEELYTLSFDNNEEMQLTHGHNVYIVKGSGYDHLAAADLKVGDIVINSNGEQHKITNITHETIKNTVYNLEVEDNHNYYVTENEILVHNARHISQSVPVVKY